MTKVRIRPRAQLDIDEAAEYYAVEADSAVSQRFLDSVEGALVRLRERPFVGARIEVLEPALTGLRAWPVPRFERHLVLYFASDEAIEVVRLVHSSRDRVEIFADVASVH